MPLYTRLCSKGAPQDQISKGRHLLDYTNCFPKDNNILQESLFIESLIFGYQIFESMERTIREP